MKAPIRIFLVLTLLCAGCSSNSTTAPAATTPARAATETFATFLAQGGFSSHAFTALTAGSIGLTLTSVTPSVVVGLGVGILDSSGVLCNLTSSVNATAGTTAQLTIPVDAGVYCAEVYDIGQIAGLGVSFSMTIARP